jgi:hypothetical protein
LRLTFAFFAPSGCPLGVFAVSIPDNWPALV